MDQRTQLVAQIAATMAVGQRAEHRMTADEAQRLIENAELLLSTAERAEDRRTGDEGAAHKQAMERFPSR